MAYCTLNDIRNQMSDDDLLMITDDDDLGIVDEALVTRAIADADAEIDGYAGTRYSTPLSTATAMVRKVSVDIAIFNLWGRKSMGPPENVKARYSNAVRFLKDVSAGRVSLGANAPEPQTSGGPASTKTKDDRIFTADTLKNF